MEITYNWQINQLQTAPAENDLTDVVKTIHWIYQATDGTYSADCYGVMECETPSGTDFTAYNDLTEEQIIEWLINGLNVNDLQENLIAQIEAKKNPPIVILPLPWYNL
jgi:hypothetical protein